MKIVELQTQKSQLNHWTIFRLSLSLSVYIIWRLQLKQIMGKTDKLM